MILHAIEAETNPIIVYDGWSTPLAETAPALSIFEFAPIAETRKVFVVLVEKIHRTLLAEIGHQKAPECEMLDTY